jgi:3-hydroxyacyl-[acyl-carrier-protein] dehydratase
MNQEVQIDAVAGFDIHQILKLLPHRYPILLVDRVLSVVTNQSIVALKNVSINEPFFCGHFPSKPIMPGVLILESLAQTAALLTFGATIHEQKDENLIKNRLYYFVGIDNARFKKPVEPGDQLMLHVSIERYIRGIWKFKAEAKVDNKIACQASLMCTVKYDN